MNIAGDVIQTVVTELLETMYFMAPVYLGEASPAPGAYRVAVAFTGPVQGEFHLSVARSLARRMTADFLADEVDDLDPQQVEAAIRELANVACCATMAAWKPDANFQFTVPFSLEDGAEMPWGHAFSIFTGKPEIFFEVRVADRTAA